jgi:hypothetical protein
LLFSDIRRQARFASYALAGMSAVAALTWLRRQTFPQLIEVPTFRPRTRALALQPDILGRLRELVNRWSLLGAAGLIAAIVLAMTIPALATGAPSVDASAIQSSAGVTGSSVTRVEDLSAATFVGSLPFVAQQRYFASLDGSRAPGHAFVTGGREASLAEYLQNVKAEAALPYLSDAANKTGAIEAWNAAVAEQERQRQAEAAAAEAERLASLRTSQVAGSWRAPALAGGTVLHATVTFYACVGNGFCGNMSSGQQVFEGAAACSSDLPFGTRFIVNNDPQQRVFVCLDRGALSSTWVDVWFYDIADGWAWQSLVGTASDITIIG